MVIQFYPTQGLLCFVLRQDTLTCISFIAGLSSGWLLQACSVFGREIWSTWPVSAIHRVQKRPSFWISPHYHCMVLYNIRGFNKDTLRALLSFPLKHIIKVKLDIDCFFIAISDACRMYCQQLVNCWLTNCFFFLTNGSTNSILDIWKFNLKISRITRELCPTLEN